MVRQAQNIQQQQTLPLILSQNNEVFHFTIMALPRNLLGAYKNYPNNDWDCHRRHLESMESLSLFYRKEVTTLYKTLLKHYL